MIGALAAVLHVLSFAWQAIQIIGWLAIPVSIIAERGHDPRFEGERLWYRS